MYRTKLSIAVVVHTLLIVTLDLGKAMGTLSSIAKLRSALWQMEKDLGIADLSRSELDLLYAFHAVAGRTHSDANIESEAVRHESMVQDMKHATYHRALKRLLDLGYIEVAPDHKTKRYRLSANAPI